MAAAETAAAAKAAHGTKRRERAAQRLPHFQPAERATELVGNDHDTPDLADEGARRTAAATPLTADLTNTAPVAAASRSVDSDGWGDLFSQKRHAEGSLDLVHSAAEYHNRQQRA